MPGQPETDTQASLTMPESPTTARPLEMTDDDEGHESGVVNTSSDTHGPAGDAAAAAPKASGDTPAGEPTAPGANPGAVDAPPPKPPRPITEAQKNEMILKEAFPSVDAGVIKAVLRASRGQVEPAFHALLEMTDPDAAKDDDEQDELPPPPQPPRPAPGAAGGLSQLEADEQYARQLAEHYERSGTHGSSHQRQQGERRRHQGPGARGEPGLKPNEMYDKDHSFLDDDLPVIRENLRKGFIETQSKVNSWITTFKKRIDDAFDEEEQAQQQAQQQNMATYGRRPGDPSSRRSGEYDRYDADPQVITDDFAGMRFTPDGTPIRDGRPPANPDLFRPPPPSKSPKPGNGRRVAFKDGAEDIDAYTSSPKLGARPETPPGNKQSKWQPLSSVDPNPIADNDPFSLGDSEDERDVKEKGPGAGVGKEGKGEEDAERLRKAAAEAMADSLVEGKQGETGSKS